MNRREALKHTALMFGVAASPATITRALAGLAPAGGTPRYLTSSQYQVVAAMAERLLPASDTPGAAEAGVPEFIDVAYGLFTSREGRNDLRTGIAALDRMGFDQLSGAEQDDVIRSIATENAAPGKSWLRQFRGLAFNGYFTSEAAAKSGFNWDPIPGNGSNQTQCIPLAETGGVSFYE
jgi:hypothetical protein